MTTTWSALMSSRKFWIGALTLAAIASATAMVIAKVIPTTEFLGTITAITAVGGVSINAIAKEDAAQKGAASVSAIAGELLETTGKDEKK